MYLCVVLIKGRIDTNEKEVAYYINRNSTQLNLNNIAYLSYISSPDVGDIHRTVLLMSSVLFILLLFT